MNEFIRNERNLVKELEKKLNKIVLNPFNKISIHNRINVNEIKTEFYNKFNYYPVLQPEIDMIFRTHDNKLNAIEVKYLTKKKNYSFSYYFGIGQALSLKRFGFDHVGLWLLIDEDIPEKEIHKYGSAAWSLIRNDLKLNLEYSYFKVSQRKKNINFSVMQYKEKLRGFEIAKNINDNNFCVTWKYQNEIKCYDEPKYLRYLIEKYICI
jgi:hypothetical protein